jgi:hypothetical protein
MGTASHVLPDDKIDRIHIGKGYPISPSTQWADNDQSIEHTNRFDRMLSILHVKKEEKFDRQFVKMCILL